MGLVALLKSGLVGGLGFIIAIGAVIALLTFSSQSLQSTMIKVRKLPAVITLFIVWGIGWGVAYWYFLTIKGVSTPPDEIVATLFACLLTLTPSFAIVCAAFAYYLEVQKAINVKNKE